MTLPLPTAATTTSYYLYGSAEPPTAASMIDEAILSHRPAEVDVDVQAFMTIGAGRFSVGALSELVAAFFEASTGQIPVGTYTKVELAHPDLLNVDSYGITFQAYEFADSTDDIAERTYIYNSQAFQLADDVRFVVNADGTRYIENYRIIPNDDVVENFDFVSDSWAAQLGNDYLEKRVDPWGIGRTVEFNFVGQVAPRVLSYGVVEYNQDIADIAAWRDAAPFSVLSLKPEIDELLQSMFDAGITKFVDSDGKAIMYGTDEADILSASQVVFETRAPMLVEYAQNGVHIVAGKGNDLLIGSDKPDSLFGGDGADTILAGRIDGNNPAVDPNSPPPLEKIDGGAGTDYLVVTGGEDSIITVAEGDAGDHLLVHASLFDLPGGEGGKIPLFLLTGGVLTNTYSDPEDEAAASDINNAWETDAATGEQLIRFPFDTTIGETDIFVEYRRYMGGRLEICIFEPEDLVEDGDLILPIPTRKIVIENFVVGDYGIHLIGPISFYTPDHDEGDPVPPVDAQAQAAYDEAVALLNEDLLTYSLSAKEGGIAGLNSSFALNGEPLITAENLIMALDGTAGDDRLRGIDVSELISGGDGDDRLIGKGGDDIIHGDVGDDRLVGGTGADVLDGGDGIDRAIYRRSASGVTVSLALGTGLGGDAEGDTLIDVEYLTGSEFADTLTGDGNVNHLFGEAGDDVLDGGAENDVLAGGLGADTLAGGDGDKDVADYRGAEEGVALNLITGGTGGEAAGDTYSGVEFVFGSDFADTITGDGSVNRLVGGAGDDVLDGGAENDVLIGGLGADTLAGGDGDKDVADYRGAGEGVSLNLVTGGTGGEAAGDTYSEIEFVFGSDFADTITGDASINRLVGGAGDDSLDGGAGKDSIVGGEGDDILTRGLGADVFIFDAFSGQDVIEDFWAGAGQTDRIRFIDDQFVDFADVVSHASDGAEGAVIALDSGDRITLAGLQVAQLHADDFLFV